MGGPWIAEDACGKATYAKQAYLDGPASVSKAFAGTAATVRDSIDHTFGRSISLADRIESMVERLVGAVPETEGKGGINGADGLLNDLAATAQYIAGRVGSAHSALDRLEARLG